MSRDKDTFLSKTLSWLLRHSAAEENLTISPDGFIPVSEILNHRSLKGKCTFPDVQRVVENNEKQRFSLRAREGVWEIRANQGHSLSSVQALELEPLTDASSFKNVIHGTYFKNLAQIQREGLSRMNRNHIHFAHDLPGSKDVISGIRKNAQVFIYIDLAKALSEAPFTADKVGDIEEYFKQFGNILHTNVTALEDALQITYQFEDRKVYTKILHQEHKIASKSLEIAFAPIASNKQVQNRQNLIVVAPLKQEKPLGEVVIVKNTPEAPAKPVKQESIAQRLKKEKMDGKNAKILYTSVS